MKEKNSVGRVTRSQLQELYSPIAAFDRQCKEQDVPPAEREFRFAQEELGRQWCFDRAWPALRVAFEYEGGTTSLDPRKRLGHTSAERYRSDCEKYSWAAIFGWRVIRGDKDMVKDGTALRLVQTALLAAVVERSA